MYHIAERKAINKTINKIYMKKANNIIVFLVSFFLGILVSFFYFFNKENKNNDKLVLNILKEENNDISFRAKKLLSIFTENSIDTTVQEFLLLKKMDLLSDYFNTVCSSNKEYNYFSIDTIKSIINDSSVYVYLEDFYEIAEKVSPQNNTLIENEWYINLCFNVILNRFFRKYKELSLIIGWEDCVVKSKKDTVEIGDFFEGNIYFSIKDLTRTYTIKFDDGTVYKGDVYKEKTVKKGLNTRKGEFYFFNGEISYGYPIEFTFYVK
jgi:hypothetical protein